MRSYTSAQHRKRLEAEYREGRRLIEPNRITAALDVRGLDGPEVDAQCGAREPAVDHWEQGTAAPTWEQIEKLAALTEMPVEFFFRPPGEAVTFQGAWICGSNGCELREPQPVVAPYDPKAPLARIYNLFI